MLRRATEGPFAAADAGFRADLDMGTAGDLYVAPGGNDGNPGTLAQPKATIAGAIAAATAGDVILLRAGTYRETATLDGTTNITLQRYGAEQAIISGFEAMTGWTQCGAGDSAVLGATLGVLGSPVWKKSGIAKSAFPGSNVRAAHLHQAGTYLRPASFRVAQPFLPDEDYEEADWETADSIVLSGSNITGFVDATLGAYTQAQIERCDCLIHYGSNLSTRVAVSSWTAGSNTLAIDTSAGPYLQDGAGGSNRFRLMNLLPAMRRGEWGYTDDGATVTLYLWPLDAGTIESTIDYSARSRGCRAKTAVNPRLRGLVIEGHAGAGVAFDEEVPVLIGDNITPSAAGCATENVLIRKCYRTLRSDRGGLTIGKVDGTLISRAEVRDAKGLFGLAFSGGSGLHVDLSLFQRVSNSPIRIYSATDALISRCRTPDCGRLAHANRFNAYEGCDDLTVFSCDFRGANGYLTWQKASGVSIVMSLTSSPERNGATDARAIVDQNFGTAGNYAPATIAGVNKTSRILNNTVLPYPDALADTDSLTLSAVGETNVKYAVKNNLLGGYSIANASLLDTAGLRSNVLTAGAVHAEAAGTDLASTHGAVYEGAATMDYRIRAASPSRSHAATSIAADIAALEALHPGYDFRRDINGRSFDPAAPPIGCMVDHTLPPLAPLIKEMPSIGGTPISGGTLTAENIVVHASPAAALTYQWRWTSDLITWTDIAGATGASYNPVSGDIGRILGCAITATNASGAATIFAYAPSTVAASFPLGDPVVAQKATYGASSIASREFASFTTQNRPMIVLVAAKLATGADTAMTVTVGNAGRGSGGTSVPQKFSARRGSFQVSAHYVAAPGANANQTIIVAGAANFTHMLIWVVYVDGATDIVAVGNNQLTGAGPVNPSVTTTAANQIALWVGLKEVGANTANAVLVLTGAATLGTGFTTLADTAASFAGTVILGWEQVASAGAASATISLPPGNTDSSTFIGAGFAVSST